jgi:acetyl-CoA acyltransferase 1
VSEITFDADDGIRADTTAAGLAKLPPAFDKNGVTTAGTSSQVSDGAAASLLMTRKKAKSLGLPILGVFRSFAVVGCAPEIMGIGPAVAIPAVLKQAGLSVADIGLFELNEGMCLCLCLCLSHAVCMRACSIVIVSVCTALYDARVRV